MNAAYHARNLCIGIVDGVIIPVVLAVVLSRTDIPPSTIVIACLAVTLGGAITMTAGSFIEGRKYEANQFTFGSALVVGAGYLLGGSVISFPFLIFQDKQTALRAAVICGSLLLIVSGFIESRIHGANAWLGALRSWLTGAVAVALAYWIAGLF